MPDEDVSLNFQWALEPANAALFANELVNAALAVDGIELDYSVGSLERVDAIVEGFRTAALGASDVGAMLINIGFYLGEVHVRHGGANWILSAGISQTEYATFPVILSWPHSGRLANPFAQVFKRLEEGPVQDFGVYFDARADH